MIGVLPRVQLAIAGSRDAAREHGALELRVRVGAVIEQHLAR